MNLLITRRGLAAAVSTLLGVGTMPADAVADDTVALIERRHGGRLGLFVRDTGSGRTLTHRADERFLMYSTFKGVLAALVLSHVDAGRDDLANLVPYGEKDLVGFSPITSAHARKGVLPVGVLCSALIWFSDNGAANLLLARIGGPAALTACARGLGDQLTRFDRYEDAARHCSGLLGATTTPRAVAETARTIVLGDALYPESRERLERWMSGNVTGRTRLRASFPPDWTVSDMTGTVDGECSDYAIARRPGRMPLVMAVHHDISGIGLAKQEAVLREIGSAIVTWAA